MSTPAFAALVFACFSALLGLRFGLGPLLGVSPAAVSATALERGPETPVAVPPKPGGARGPDAAGDGATPGAPPPPLTRRDCDGMPRAVRDACRQALARQLALRDPDGARDVCASVEDVEKRWECEADVAELLASEDRVAAEAICGGIPVRKWRGQCHFGLGLALADVDPEGALSRCDRAEAFRDFCRHDVVGEVARVDPPAAIALCAQEEGDALTRKTCWHGIGKYLARRDAGAAAAACAQATPAWRDGCFHGLGWGAAEQGPDAALASCSAYGQHADPCRQGVAHQLKRSDPLRALAICEGIGTGPVKARCLAFLRR